jgi:hypothetical protein
MWPDYCGLVGGGFAGDDPSAGGGVSVGGVAPPGAMSAGGAVSAGAVVEGAGAVAASFDMLSVAGLGLLSRLLQPAASSAAAAHSGIANRMVMECSRK